MECKYNSEFYAKFPAKEYLLEKCTDPKADPRKVKTCFMKEFHSFYDKYISGNGSSMMTLLEFGGGPSIYSLISAAKHVGSITFAEYAPSNRHEIELWMNEKGQAQVILTLPCGSTAGVQWRIYWSVNLVVYIYEYHLLEAV